jgi:foldase protein PrsA
MINFIKKNWFIVLIGILFAGATVFFALEQTKDLLPGKTVNGKDIVFEINGQAITADEYYLELERTFGIQAVYQLFERAVLSQVGNRTPDIITDARLQADSTIKSFKDYYGADYETYLLEALKAVGIDRISDMHLFFESALMLEDLLTTYFTEEAQFNQFLEQRKPRIISHILVRMTNPNQPTEAEQTKLDTVKAKIEAGEDFAQLAKQYSDDTGSVAANGSLGLVDSTTQFVPEFLAASLALTEEGQLSAWVKTTYGYHIIRLDSLAKADIVKDQKFLSSMVSLFPNAQQTLIWEKAQSLGLTFGNAEFEQKFLDYFAELNKEEGDE